MVTKVPKILLVYDVSYPHMEGGGQRRMYEVAKRLVSQGYLVDWVCFKTWDGESVTTSEAGIRYIGIPGYRGLYRKDGSRRRLEPIEFLLAMLRCRIDFNDYEYIWSGQWPMLHLGWWLLWPKAIRNSKLIVDWWEIWGETWLNYSRRVGFIGYYLEKALISGLSKRGSLVLIAPSAFKQARKLAPKGNLVLIHNGIDLAAFNAEKADTKPKFDIAYVGRLKDHKRVDLLLLALNILNKTYNQRLSAVIIGSGPESISLKSLAESLDLAGQITFTGAISSNQQVYEILESAKVFVNPSTKEGGGSITLLEAFASGLPVVAFECKDGIDPELIGDGITGKLVKSVSAEALSDALFELFNDQELLERLGQGAKAAAHNYDWNAIANQYIDLLESTN